MALTPCPYGPVSHTAESPANPSVRLLLAPPTRATVAAAAAAAAAGTSRLLLVPRATGKVGGFGQKSPKAEQGEHFQRRIFTSFPYAAAFSAQPGRRQGGSRGGNTRQTSARAAKSSSDNGAPHCDLGPWDTTSTVASDVVADVSIEAVLQHQADGAATSPPSSLPSSQTTTSSADDVAAPQNGIGSANVTPPPPSSHEQLQQLFVAVDTEDEDERGSSVSSSGSSGSLAGFRRHIAALEVDWEDVDADESEEEEAAAALRAEARRSMSEGLMPPWKQEGLMEDVAGFDVETLVAADAVYNKELSWLAFNWRVLFMALDKRTPLIERLHFLSISGRNLDEFFCKRVGALKRQEAVGMENLIMRRSLLWSPTHTLKIVAREVERMVQTQISCLQMDIFPALRKEGIHVLHWDDLDKTAKEQMRHTFGTSLEPLLTPLAVDPGHPFPFMGNMTLAIAVVLRDPLDGDEEFAIVTVPSSCDRWLRVGQLHDYSGNELQSPIGGINNFILVEEVIKANLQTLFGGHQILSAHCFRVTRNADVERNEEEAEDLLEMITDEMRERKFAPFVRLEVDCDMPDGVVSKLAQELGLKKEGRDSDKDDIYYICGPLALGEMDTMPIRIEPGTPLEFPSWAPQTHPRLQGAANIFDVIRTGGDVLVHHPFHSFGTSVLQFVETAARDPKVRAIKATLYRTSADSPVISALIQAAEYGKQVAVLVELKARFDEARNVGFAQKLENAGCHVAYGLVGLKTHCKCIMVVREEEDGFRTYVHIGTGNYNPRTATVYTDFGLFSCDPALGEDVRDLFKYLTGYHRQTAYNKLLVAPSSMRSEFLRLIDREMANAAAGLPAGVVVKCNGLDDEVMVTKLYEAAMAGVKVDCIVRGMCRLRPGVPGVSENIRVISILGRFLEHHRIFRFLNGGNPQYYIGSADWMARNLTRRVEVVTPASDPAIQKELQNIIEACLCDKHQAWELQADGRYRLLGASPVYISTHPELPRPSPGNKLAPAETIGLHQALMNLTLRRSKRAKKVSLKKREGSPSKSRRFLESLYESSTS